MKVSKLLAFLEELDPDMEIVVPSSEDGSYVFDFLLPEYVNVITGFEANDSVVHSECDEDVLSSYLLIGCKSELEE